MILTNLDSNLPILADLGFEVPKDSMGRFSLVFREVRLYELPTWIDLVSKSVKEEKEMLGSALIDKTFSAPEAKRDIELATAEMRVNMDKVLARGGLLMLLNPDLKLSAYTQPSLLGKQNSHLDLKCCWINVKVLLWCLKVSAPKACPEICCSC